MEQGIRRIAIALLTSCCLAAVPPVFSLAIDGNAASFTLNPEGGCE